MTSGIFTCTTRSVPPPDRVTVSGIPPLSQSLQKNLERYQHWTYATLVGYAPHGDGIIVLSREGETAQLFRVEKKRGAARRLTRQSAAVIGATVCPAAGAGAVFFTSDIGGNENFQISCVGIDSATIRHITSDSGASNDGVLFSNRGDRFVYSSNRRNGIDFDIWCASVEQSQRAACICSCGGAWSALDWSPDDAKLLLNHYVSRTLSRLYIFDIGSGMLSALTDTTVEVSEELGAFTADGRGVYFTSDGGSDLRTLRVRYPAAGEEVTLSGMIPWDIREIECSHSRTTVAFTTNENGFYHLYTIYTPTGVVTEVTGLPRGIIGGLDFHPDDTALAMTVSTACAPDDVYELSLGSGIVSRWTDNTPAFCTDTAGCIPIVKTVAGYDSFAGAPLQIPCLVYTPADAEPPYPVLILLHGGPETQFWPSFRPELLFYLRELHCAVVAPNVRGSGGYGKRYLSLDDGTTRVGAVQDVGALLDWIAAQPLFDATRVMVSGGSYGGFLSLAAMTKYSDRLCGGIDCYGIANFITFLEKTAGYRRDLRRIEYGDERDSTMRAFLRSVSPVNHAGDITKPLLVIQGANDARVPLAESEQIVSRVRDNGVDVWFMIALDEGHGFRSKTVRDYQDLVTASFMIRYLH